MNTRVHGGLLFVLLTVAMGAPLLLPAFPAALVGVSALLGALAVLERTGALRARFIVLLIATVLSAIAIGLFRKGVW